MTEYYPYFRHTIPLIYLTRPNSHSHSHTRFHSRKSTIIGILNHDWQKSRPKTCSLLFYWLPSNRFTPFSIITLYGFWYQLNETFTSYNMGPI